MSDVTTDFTSDFEALGGQPGLGNNNNTYGGCSSRSPTNSVTVRFAQPAVRQRSHNLADPERDPTGPALSS
jgi:hypothetical protein